MAVRQWLRWIHLASVGVFGGAMVMLLVLAGSADPVSPLTFGAVRQAMSIASAAVLVPALLLMLLTGFLLLVARPLLIDARWVWAKALIGVVIAGISFFSVYPAMNRATGYAVQSAAGSVIQAAAGQAAAARGPMDQALAAERTGRWINLLLVAVATALAVWRPQLGGGARAPLSPQSPQTPTAPHAPDAPAGSRSTRVAAAMAARAGGRTAAPRAAIVDTTDPDTDAPRRAVVIPLPARPGASPARAAAAVPHAAAATVAPPRRPRPPLRRVQ